MAEKEMPYYWWRVKGNKNRFFFKDTNGRIFEIEISYMADGGFFSGETVREFYAGIPSFGKCTAKETKQFSAVLAKVNTEIVRLNKKYKGAKVVR
mgnify:CR=1 FL=1|tara:strand:+ start:1472 stop:1756 length:285 start_codon:yes stop_codon:yes gene_type:complete